MAKIFVQSGSNEQYLLGTLSKLSKKFHGEFFGTAPNDGRLVFGFAKNGHAIKFRNAIRIYKCWTQLVK